MGLNRKIRPENLNSPTHRDAPSNDIAQGQNSLLRPIDCEKRIKLL